MNNVNNNNRMDWKVKLPNTERNYEEDTRTRFLDRKLLFGIVVAVFACIDFIIAIYGSAVRQYSGVYQFEPWLLFFADVGMLVFSIFINLRQKGAKIGFFVYALITFILTVLTVSLAFTHKGTVVMSAFAAAFLLVVTVVKLFTVGWGIFVLPNSYWNSLLYLRKCVFYGVGLCVCVAYLVFNSFYGIMGQNIAVVDKEATLSFADNGNGELVVVGTVDDGNIISVPESFNGRKVVGIQADVLNDTKITLLKTGNDYFRIFDVEKLKEINPDLRVEIGKEALNDTREDLFYQLREYEYSAVGEKLLNNVVPSNLSEDETYYHYIYAGEAPEKLVYIPTVIAGKDSFDSTAAYASMGGYFAHTEISSQDDLKWCFDNNYGYILDESNITVEQNRVSVPFSKVNYLKSMDGNDAKWTTTVPNMYVSTADLKKYYEDLPSRDGFDVLWFAAYTEVNDATSFESYFSSRCGQTVNISPKWSVQAPVITLNAADKAITYGENTVLSVKAQSVLPRTYRLYKGADLIASQTDGEFELNGYDPTQSGGYEIRITASDPEITALTSQATVTSFNFNIAKKTMHVSWTLPDGEIYDKNPKPITCEYDVNDVVKATDEIVLTQSASSVVRAGDYTVSASLDGRCDNLYKLDDNATVSFTVVPLPVRVEWQTLSEFELIYTRSEKQTSARVSNLIDDDACSVDIEITSENRMGAGEVEYSAVSLGNTDYTLVNGENTKNIYVILPLEIEFNWQIPEDLIYNAEEKRASVNVFNIYDGDECEIDIAHDGDNVSAGEVNYAAIGLLGADRANYVLPKEGLMTAFTIEQKLAYFTWDELSEEERTYSGKEKTVNAKVNNRCGEDEITVNVEIISDNRFRVGEVSYRAVSLDNKNYRLSEESGWGTVIEILQLPVNVSWQLPSEEELVYDKTEKTATPVITNRAEGDECFVITTNTPNIEVGTVYYTCVALEGEHSYNYSLMGEEFPVQFEITRRQVSFEWLTPASDLLVYDGTAKESGWEIRNVIEGDECLALVSQARDGILTEDFISAGSVTYTANDLIGLNSANYKLAETEADRSVTYEIRKRAVSLSWTVPQNAVYDKTAKLAETEFLNRVDGDDCELYIEYDDNVNAGTVTCKAVLQGEKSENYTLIDVAEAETSFEIAQKLAFLSWASLTEAEREYCGVELPTVAATIGNAEEGDEYNVKLEITSDNKFEVGDVSYRAVEIEYNANYCLTEASGLTKTYAIIKRLIDFTWVTPTGEDAIYNAQEKIAYPLFNNRVGEDDCEIVTEHGENIVNAGLVEYGITGLRGEKSKNYRLPTENLSTTFDIEKRPVMIEWSELTAEELVYNRQPKTVAAKVTNNQGADDCLATVTRRSENEYDAGEVVYEVTDLSDNLNYRIDALSNAVKTYTITKLKVVLNWTLPQNAIYDGTEKTASAEIGNLIGNDDCTLFIEHTDNISAGRVTYTVRELRGEKRNNYELPTLGLVKSFDIEKLTLDVAWTTPTDLEYNGEAKAASVRFTNIVGDDECTPITGNTDNRNAGEVTYTLTGIDGEKKGNYKLPLTNLTVKYNITPIEAQLAWVTPTDLIYNGTQKTATVAVANKIYGDDCGIRVTHGDNVSAGRVVYTAAEFTGTHKGNYAMPTLNTVEFTINPMTVAIGWTLPQNAVYDGAQKTASATITNKVSGDDCYLVVKHTNNINAGTASCEVSGLSGSKKGNYSLEAATDKEKTFEIAKCTAVLKWTELSSAQLVYDGEEKPMQATVDNRASDCSVTVSITSVNRKNVGEVIYKAVALSDEANYMLPSETEYSIEITKRVIDIKWTNPADQIYDGAAKEATAELMNLVLGDDCTLTVAHQNNINAGTAAATVTALNGADKDNYEIPTNATRRFAINQRPVTISWTLPNTTYNGQNKIATATLNNVIESDRAKIVMHIVHSSDVKNVGEVVSEIVKLDGDKGLNYQLPSNESDRQVKFTIKPLAVNINWITPENAVYDGQPKSAKANITNLIAGDDVSVFIGYTPNNVNAGTVSCKALGLKGEQKNNYTLTDASTTTFVIDKAERRATVEMADYAYGVTPTNPKVTHIVGDEAPVTFAYAERGSEDYSPNKPTAAGDYTVKATVAESDDYKALTVTGDFKVVQRTVSVKWTLVGSDVYDGKEKNVVATAQGLVSGDKCKVNIEIVTANRYEGGDVIYRASGLDNANYTIDPATATYTLKIKQATRSGITVTMDDWTVGEATKNPTVTGYSGARKISYAPEGGQLFTSTKPTTAGKYIVKLTIEEDNNYYEYVATDTFTIYAQ